MSSRSVNSGLVEDRSGMISSSQKGDAKRRRKVCVVIASRAHYGRLKPVLNAISEHSLLELQLVVGASALLQRYGNIRKTIEEDGFTVKMTYYAILEGENPLTMAKSTGLAIMELSTIFDNLKPDIVLTHADRYETLATAIAATYMNIPLAHNQGGEVTGSIDESVRHAITKLAHIHLTTNEETARRIIAMGEPEETVFITGCPSIDLVKSLRLRIDDGFDRRYASTGVGTPIDFRKPYLVVMQHPVTTEYGAGLQQVEETLAAIEDLQVQTAWFWPNVDAGSDEISKGLRLFRERHRNGNVHFFKNLPPEDFLTLIANAACCVGNSSSFIREGSFLGVPAVEIGSRQEGRAVAENVLRVPSDRERIRAAIEQQLAHGRYPSSTLYGDGNASGRIVEVLASCELKIQKRITY